LGLKKQDIIEYHPRSGIGSRIVSFTDNQKKFLEKASPARSAGKKDKPQRTHEAAKIRELKLGQSSQEKASGNERITALQLYPVRSG
jgi:hypothetical protein